MKLTIFKYEERVLALDELNPKTIALVFSALDLILKKNAIKVLLIANNRKKNIGNIIIKDLGK